MHRGEIFRRQPTSLDQRMLDEHLGFRVDFREELDLPANASGNQPASLQRQ